MDTLFKISAGTIKHKHTCNPGTGSLLTVYRQVGYFHWAANCVINSLHTESTVRSPGDSVCERRVCVTLFFFLPLSLSLSPFQCPSPAPWLLRVTGWVSLLYFSYLPSPDYTECSPVGGALWITVHSRSPVSASVPRSFTLSAACTLLPVFQCGHAVRWPRYNPSDYKKQKTLSPFLFLARLNRSSGTLPVDAYAPTHKVFFLSIRLKLTVFTLAFPSGSAGYIINPPLQFTGATC